MKFPIKLINDNTKINFLSNRKICFIASSLLIAISISFLFIKGLNFGIDFRGGTLIEIQKINGDADVSNIRELMKNIDIGDVQIQEFGSSSDVLIRVEQQNGGDSAQQNVIKLVKEVIGSQYEFRRVEVVGPKVSSELVYNTTAAIARVIAAVVFYIWFRFEWQFSIGAMLALMHDIMITIGLFSILQLEFNLSIIAAILTIVGYSLNDTVVVYDRIREELRKYKTMNFLDLLNLAVNSTLSRTTITSVTTLLALLSLYIFGGEVIRGFTFAMIWGVIIGTYSSIFIAAPVLLYLNVKRDWSEVS